MLERLLPSVVASAETTEDRLAIELFPSERRSLGRAVDKRRREFVTGRACARLALGQLGAPVMPIPSGVHGEPLWPAGFVGSITHCLGYRACAAARSDVVRSLGIDAEPNAPLPDGVLELVAFGKERERVAEPSPAAAGGGRVNLPRLLFSAKEATYKAWFPLTERWLGFEDVDLSIDLSRGCFRAALLVDGPVVHGTRLTEFAGRWAIEDGIILTAIVIR
jgi:enterobactin synthetase component D / holo-[acyl-carrier protein] synthase